MNIQSIILLIIIVILSVFAIIYSVKNKNQCSGDSAGGFDMALKSKIVIKSIGKRCDFLRKSFK